MIWSVVSTVWLGLFWIAVFLGMPFIWGQHCARLGRDHNLLQREAPFRAVALVLSLAGAAWLLKIKVDRWLVAVPLAAACLGFAWERRRPRQEAIRPRTPLGALNSELFTSVRTIASDSPISATVEPSMSVASDLAAHVLLLIAQGSNVPTTDQMHLRYFARNDEITLPLPELARRVLEREKESV